MSVGRKYLAACFKCQATRAIGRKVWSILSSRNHESQPGALQEDLVISMNGRPFKTLTWRYSISHDKRAVLPKSSVTNRSFAHSATVEPWTTKPVFKQEEHASKHVIFLYFVKGIRDARESGKNNLHVWWALLSHSMFSSSFALKVTVEANFDTVVEGAIETFDATFAVKSAGTLFRRLDAIQAYDDWCVSIWGSIGCRFQSLMFGSTSRGCRRLTRQQPNQEVWLKIGGSVGICLVPLVQTQLNQVWGWQVYHFRSELQSDHGNRPIC